MRSFIPVLELHALEYETRRAVLAVECAARLIAICFTRKPASKKELQIE
jgi:hypothetical protein